MGSTCFDSVKPCDSESTGDIQIHFSYGLLRVKNIAEVAPTVGHGVNARTQSIDGKPLPFYQTLSLATGPFLCDLLSPSMFRKNAHTFSRTLPIPCPHGNRCSYASGFRYVILNCFFSRPIVEQAGVRLPQVGRPLPRVRHRSPEEILEGNARSGARWPLRWGEYRYTFMLQNNTTVQQYGSTRYSSWF